MVSSNSSVVAANKQASSALGLSQTKISSPQEFDSWQIKGIDYVELYVGNVFQAAHFYRTAFGFMPVAYAGLETGVRDRVSFVVEQSNIRLVLTGAIAPDSPIARHVALHGDAVKDIAFRVDDTAHVFEEIVKRGAKPLLEPTVYKAENGQVIKATIAACGDTVHSLIQRDTYEGIFSKNYRRINSPPTHSIGITALDHLTVCIEQGQLEYWINFYKLVMGFREIYGMNLMAEDTGMKLRLMEDARKLIKLVLVEPIPLSTPSQIEQYLRFNVGAGVQHLAFSSNNIVSTAWQLRLNGIESVHIPDSYYEMLEKRIGKIDEDLAALRKFRILVDQDDDGYLLQFFTKALQSRPTFFLEIIQRHGTRSFGQNNIKALFEAVNRNRLNSQ